jgi:hypothetical protein
MRNIIYNEDCKETLNRMKDKEDISDIDKQILIKEENRKKSISEKSKATFEVKNINTGEEFIIVSVENLVS